MGTLGCQQTTGQSLAIGVAGLAAVPVGRQDVQVELVDADITIEVPLRWTNTDVSLME